ncbi:MAG: N-acetylmuramoyl-L-alanine amidase, partial [candidate division Zixibacteria bacterium]|nr:N-acetylmuramoyl-L-alanine amidase [candidate division Zixibacteria bacterium]
MHIIKSSVFDTGFYAAFHTALHILFYVKLNRKANGYTRNRCFQNGTSRVLYSLGLSLVVVLFPLSDHVCLAEKINEIDVSISGKIEKINSFQSGEICYFSFSQFIELYGEDLSWGILGQSITHETGKSRLTFFPGSEFISLNDTALNMTYPARLYRGALYMPALTFIPIYDRCKSDKIIWDPEKSRIRIEEGFYNISDLGVSQKVNGVLIEVYLTEELSYEINESEGNWININFPGGRVNKEVIESRRGSPFLRDVNAFQFESSAQVSIRFRRNPVSYTSKYNSETGCLQISALESQSSLGSSQNNVRSIGPDNTIDVIVIDPGHGGSDLGAVGRKRTKEKHVALEIARELARMIRKDKLFKVILTRDKDFDVTLEERARIANEAHADIFISIHANASVNRQARGSQVFFLAPAKNDAARALAQAENASFLTEGGSVTFDPDAELSVILNDMIQNIYQEESAE